MKNELPKLSIIGFGRFGELFADILKDSFQIQVVEPDSSRRELAKKKGFSLCSDKEAFNADNITYCVPISLLEKTLKEHAQYFNTIKESKTILDVLSVKVHPKILFERHLPKHFQLLLTHPMFGPDSVLASGMKDKTIVIDPLRITTTDKAVWEKLFADKGLRVVELSAEQHDQIAAQSQGITHFIGRILGELNIHPSPIDTMGAQKLHEVREQVCNDSWQLFLDLQTYNPYTLPMRVKLGEVQDKIYNLLLPNRVHTDKLVVGIQGGKGSFNEQAARYYLEKSGIKDFELAYLYTTENVLKALHEGTVDRGQFAIHNSLGGIVTESVDAMSRYNFNIVEEYEIKIAHALMIRPDAQFNEIDTIMTHPMVLRQCTTNLAKKYSKLNQTSGEGDLIDHANVADHLSQKKLPKNIATMGSKVLADIYGLTIIESELQDLEENFTSFLWVERRN